MDAGTIQARPDPIINTTSSLQAKSVGNNEPAIETRPDNDQDDSLKTPKETVNFSDTSLKLSASSPVKSSDQSPVIDNQDQAQQASSRFIADMQSNPVQALAAHSNIFEGAVKLLLG
ncbi:MAG: hypothetical protein ACXWFI_00805 [Methylobacter sp.]